MFIHHYMLVTMVTLVLLLNLVSTFIANFKLKLITASHFSFKVTHAQYMFWLLLVSKMIRILVQSTTAHIFERY